MKTLIVQLRISELFGENQIDQVNGIKLNDKQEANKMFGQDNVFTVEQFTSLINEGDFDSEQYEIAYVYIYQ